MIRYLLLVLFINLCFSCDLKPNKISKISGAWRVVELSTPYRDSLIVEKPSKSEARILTIRNDGIMFNTSGELICCFPENYKVDGVLVEVKRTGSTNNSRCDFDCPNVEGLEVYNISKDSIRIKWGDGVVAKYARER